MNAGPRWSPLRLALTSDLHLDSTEANRALVPHLARAIAAREPDVLVVAGDVSPYPERLREALTELAFAAPVRLFVPGNHDVWVARSAQAEGATSTAKYDGEIADVCREAGFAHLGRGPHVAGRVGFAGTIGWYDYSFAHPAFPFSREEFARRTYGRHRWMDSFYARWVAPDRFTPLTDAEVVQDCAAALAGQLASLAGRGGVRDVVVVTHHLPYVHVVHEPREAAHGYFRVFLGARVLGDVIDACPLVRAVLVGHLHRPLDARTPRGARLVSAPVGYLRPPPDDLDAVARTSVRIVDL